MKLLLIEDDAELRERIEAFLLAQNYLCETASDFQSARLKIEDYDYDCIILDLTLPGGDGLQLLRLLKEDAKEDGVIIISARADLDDRIAGISLGADDYLTKPFHLSELAVRIAAIIRRKKLHGSEKVCFEEIEIDISAQRVLVGETELVLTRKEYELLLYFLINKNRVISKNAIAAHLWGDEMDIAENYDFIYTHVKNLRKKLEAIGTPNYLQSVYGMGYKFSLK
ncbi:MAG: response regulator transcription factor [Chitinophagaceae bacterium]